MASLEQFQGCLLGLALGDALGAPFEGGLLERFLWRAIGFTRRGEMRWTDDTQMTIDLVESFLEKGEIDSDDLAKRFAMNYRWSRGYGPAAAKMLKRIRQGANWRIANSSVYRDGSFGNGAAMRAPILGLVYDDRADRLPDAVRRSGIVTHAHPLGLEGALLVAFVASLAANARSSREIVRESLDICSLPDFRSRLEVASTWIESNVPVSVTDVRRQLGNGISAHQSCVTAVYLALRFRNQSYLEMQRFIVQLKGDVDTIGAMAGAIWGTFNGLSKLPEGPLERLEQNERIERLAEKLCRRVNN